MKGKSTLLLLPLLMIGLVSCDENLDYDSLREDEMRYFNLWMNSNYPNKEYSEGELCYIEYEEGSGISPDSGDYVLLDYYLWTIPDEDLIDTYDEEKAVEYSMYSNGVLYGPYKYQTGSEIAGLREGLSKMKEGGLARLIFDSSLGYGDQSYHSIGAYQSLMYDVRLVEVIKDPAAKEKAQIEQYLRDSVSGSYEEIVGTYENADGDEEQATMYYIPGEQGSGAIIEEDSIVEVYYTGRLLDGRTFDSNSSGFKVTIGEEEVISGWEIGLQKFKKGGTGRLLIPHELAYGEDGKQTSSGKTAIPPFEALLFEIEVAETYPED